MNTSKVVLVDLRDTPGDLCAQGGAVLAGGVLVVDHAKSLVDHAETYLSLIGGDMVTSVVCVAVGESSVDNSMDGVVLTVPPALRHATVLWVGDPQGVQWAPERSSPRPVDQPVNALDSLVAALRVPPLFDRVVAAAEELPSVAANPGVQLVSGAPAPAELAEARAAAVRSLTATDQPVSHDLEASVRQFYVLPPGHDGVALSGAVLAARLEALRRLDEVAELTRTLGTVTALSGTTSDIGRQVTWAGQSVENYRLGVVELLNRMDGHLQVGHPSVEKVTELGVPEPMPVDRDEIAAGLRDALDSRAGTGAALPTLARELRLVATNSGPQGCTAALDQARAREPLGLVMPVFRKWPLPLATLPLIFLSCAVVSFLLGPAAPGWAGGGLLATMWFGSGWLLLARRPSVDTPSTATGGRSALCYGAPAVLGVAAGSVAARLLNGQASSPALTSQVLALLIAVLSLVVVILSWRSAGRRWHEQLGVPQLREAVADLTRLVEDVTAREWLPMRRRQAIAAVATEVATGLEEIAGTLKDTGNRLFVAPPSDGPVRAAKPVSHELYTVVRGDLADLCHAALEPAWPATGTGIRTPEGMYAQRLDGMLGEYGSDVMLHGLMAATRFSRDQAARDALTARGISESPAAVAALRTEVDSEMTQLCRNGQLGYLSTAAEPVLVRFAPSRLRRVLESEGVHKAVSTDPGIVWSEDGEFVGALRLLPLRPESMRYVLGGAQ